MNKEIDWLHDVDTLNSAIIVLQDECNHHNSCKDCPLATVHYKCGLMETYPSRYSLLEDYDD